MGEALNLSQEVVHGSQSQGSDLEELWYLCPDPFPPSGFSVLSSWFRSADEAGLETVVLKMNIDIALTKITQITLCTD